VHKDLWFDLKLCDMTSPTPFDKSIDISSNVRPKEMLRGGR